MPDTISLEKDRRNHTALLFLLILTLASYTFLLINTVTPVKAQGSTLYVAHDGNCGEAAPCYSSIQSAVDNASLYDTIKVAEGVYTGDGLEVVYIDKGVALSGGYAVSNWEIPDPVSHASVIDAERSPGRRGIMIDCSSKVTVANLQVRFAKAYGIYVVTGTVLLESNQVGWCEGGLRVDNGAVSARSSVFQGNHVPECGGGMLVNNGYIVLDNNTFAGNTSSSGDWHDAHDGGGVCVNGGNVFIHNNTFRGNTADRWGGAVCVYAGMVTLEGNILRDNSADNVGGGLCICDGDVVVMSNLFEQNNGGSYGGGVGISNLAGGSYSLQDNHFVDNRANCGGAVWMDRGPVTIIENYLEDNYASYMGGGLCITGGTATLRGNAFRDNGSSRKGGGLYVDWANVTMSGNTFFKNWINTDRGAAIHIARSVMEAENDIIADSSSPLEAVFVSESTVIARHWTLVDNGDYALVADGGQVLLTNTIVASHTLGAYSGSAITSNYNLFFKNGTSCSSGADCSNNYFGDPVFVDPATEDYHLGPSSAAVDKGIDVGVAMDVDGDLRPMRFGIDLGADEQSELPLASFVSSCPCWLQEPTVFANTTYTFGATTYLWSFGDTMTSTQEGPTHTYESPGLYTVTMTATNAAGSDVASDTITVYGTPSASFDTSSPDWLGQQTAFTNTTTVTPTGDPTVTYQWLIDDIQIEGIENPTHTFTTPGVHTITLTATNAAGSDLMTDTVTVYSAPAVTFTSSSPDWLADTSYFTATVTTTPPHDPSATLVWDLGDGSVLTGSDNMSHTYATPGTYSVVVTATNPAGQDAVANTMIINGPPNAAFSSSSPDWMGQTSSFTNTSSGPQPIALFWSFGDAMTSTQENPAHAYESPGLYTVIMTATNPAGSDVASDTITVYGVPGASFDTSSPDWLGQQTTLTNTTTITPPGDLTVSYLWLIDGTEIEGIENPTHTFTTPGVHTISLTATNAAGSDLVTDTVAVYSAPAITLASSGPDWLADTSYFTATVTTTPPHDPSATLVWDLGDGSILTGSDNMSHTYATPGTYSVVVTVTNPAGQDAAANTMIINGPPNAAFSSSSPDWIGQTSSFTNTSSASQPIALSWSFGDTMTSTQENPAHAYESPGLYTVTMTAVNPAGSDAISHGVIIYGKPSASFSVTPTQGIRPLDITFTSTTTVQPTHDPSIEYLWSFGDGMTSTLAGPSHIYTAAEAYTVTLEVRNAAGFSIVTRTNCVTVHEPVKADFEAYPLTGSPPLSVTFTSLSTGNFASLLWDFGDGATSALESPLHQYLTPGHYTVALTARGFGGVATQTKENYITVEQYHIYLPIVLRTR